jgi:hypothetical protein
VEIDFINKGLLLPLFHKLYWLGYSSESTKWPVFKPSDATVLPLTSAGAYNHFGIMRFLDPALPAIPEPNNMAGSEYCTAANFSQTYVGAWGWSDTNCGGLGQEYPVMCMVQSEWQAGSASQQRMAACTVAATLHVCTHVVLVLHLHGDLFRT